MTQQTIEKPELFTDLSAEESATVNGACYYGYRYRRSSYYSYRPRYRYASYYYSEYRPRYRYVSYYSYRPRYSSYYDCDY